MKKKISLGLILNILIVILLTSYTYSWMVTEPSYGELVEYERDLIIASSGVLVDVYIYDGNDYILYEEEDIIIDNMAPNDSVRFKFVMKNNKSVATLTDIIFANITGDLDILSSYLTVECSSPTTFVKHFDSDLLTTSTFDGIEVTNYMRFYDDFKVETGSENTIYWTIKLDKSADNSIIDKQLIIDNIIFLNS